MPERSKSIRRKGGNRIPSSAAAESPQIGRHGGSTEAEIRHRAHELYLNRAGGYGDALGDWLLAELELRTRAGRPPVGDPP